MSKDELPTTARNLFQRLNAVMDDIGTIDKTGKNVSQNYNFIEQSVIMAKLRPLFVKHGLALIPEIVSTVYHRPEGARQTTAQCTMRFTLVNVDTPTERIEALWAAEGADMGDKGVNKAGTSGAKYFLMKLLLLSDKDDPDADVVEEPKQRQQQQRPAPPAVAGRNMAPPPQLNPHRADTVTGEIAQSPDADKPAGQPRVTRLLEVAKELFELTGESIEIPDAPTVAECNKLGMEMKQKLSAARAERAQDLALTP